MNLFELKYKIVRPQARNTLSMLVNLEETPVEVLMALNEKRRTDIVTYAFDNSPYYQDKYRHAGFNRRDILHPDNFHLLPTITRQDIRENFEYIISNKISPNLVGLSSTGGTSGIPLAFGTDLRHALEVISWRRLKSWGASPSHNSGYVYRVIPKGKAEFFRRFFYYPTRRSYLSALELTDEKVGRFLRELKRNRGVYIVAYVGALKILADYLVAHSISLPDLRFIWSTAAPLPAFLRKELEDVFKVPVYSQYGCSECYWIASERADRSGMDIDWDIRVVEVLDENKRKVPIGNYGDIVISDLINRAFPLIRYEIGDRSRFIAFNNPSKLKPLMLDFVTGRTSDTIVLKNRRRVPGEFWTTIFDEYADSISGFHIHQKSDFTIEIAFIPNHKWTQKNQLKLTKMLQVICDGTPFKLELGTVIPQVNGKLKFIISDVL
jgi:phenylacetate-CoA ligase